MNTLITKSALSIAVAFAVAACAPEGGSVAGIGGSGYISSGSVSGFGSVFVNGVEFETGSATFDVDGSSGTQADLAIGMVVRVNGNINADGITGTASSISFDDELQGPVSVVGAPDLDGIKRSITILGITIIVDSTSTTFDIDSNTVPVNTVFDFNNITVNNNIEVSGFFDTNGAIQATRLELKNITFDPGSIVEVKGSIAGLSGTTFNLANFGSLMIDASAAALDGLPDGLVNGQLVEVKGTLNAGFTTLTASKVEAKNNSVDDRDEFEIEGLITNYIDDSNFNIGEIPVNASNATREPASLMLGNDAHVEIEGSIVNGVLIAREIQAEGGNIKVHATVTKLPSATAPDTFEVSPVSGGQAIAITVSTSTKFEDDVREDKFFNINKLLINDFVEVEGYDDGSNGITATEVDVKEPGDIIVQGNLQAFVANTSITVLGVTFAVDYNNGTGETKFENSADSTITENIFITNAPISSLVKVKDKFDENVLGTADEIDIESP